MPADAGDLMNESRLLRANALTQSYCPYSYSGLLSFMLIQVRSHIAVDSPVQAQRIPAAWLSFKVKHGKT